jgi:polysaccharide export outer membrane protein
LKSEKKLAGRKSQAHSFNNALVRHVLAGSTVLALSSLFWAQAGVGSDAAPKTSTPPATAQNSDISGTPKAHDDNCVIGNDDVLVINVWKEPDVSRSIPVRSDGKISLPLAGEVQAAGRTPLKLEQDIASRLKNYIAEPEVTVIVQQINSQKFNILGQVNKPGSYPLTNSATVLDAIAMAGGFRDFAKQKSVYVLRQTPDGSQTRLAFNYKEVVKGHNPAQNIKLQARDTIVVP